MFNNFTITYKKLDEKTERWIARVELNLIPVYGKIYDSYVTLTDVLNDINLNCKFYEQRI
jgi:hypothetical protein